MENTTHNQLIAEGFQKVEWNPPIGSDPRLVAYSKVTYDDYGDWPEMLVRLYIEHLEGTEPTKYTLEYSTSRCEPATPLTILSWMEEEKDLPAFAE